MPQYPCLVCGKPSPGSHCADHRREQNADIRNSRAWRKLSEELRAREPHCRDCKAEGKTRLATQAHHPFARSQGGPLLPPIDELIPLCIDHHNKQRKEEAKGAVLEVPKRPASWPLIA